MFLFFGVKTKLLDKRADTVSLRAMICPVKFRPKWVNTAGRKGSLERDLDL